jgi:drug/metabolite transporter (DMT)-like permease
VLPETGAMKRERLPVLAALTAMSVLFGASFVAIKIGLEGFTPAQLIFLRFSLAAALFYGLSHWLRGSRVDWAGRAQIFVLALLEPGAYFVLEALGIQRTQASTAAILINTIPLFVLVLEAAWLKVPVVPREVFLILASLLGVCMLVLAGGFKEALGGSLAGNLLILAAALSASVYTVFARKLLVRYSPVTVTRLQVLYASILYLPYASWDWWRLGFKPVPASAVWSLLFLAAGCSFVAYGFLNYSLSRVKASLVAAFTNVIPVVGTALAVILLGEILYPLQILGGILVIVCVARLSKKAKDRT